MNAVTSTAAIARVPCKGAITLQEAVDVLQADAEAQGLIAASGRNGVEEILAEGFAGAAP
jgi:hypothetical protein